MEVPTGPAAFPAPMRKNALESRQRLLFSPTLNAVKRESSALKRKMSFGDRWESMLEFVVCPGSFMVFFRAK
jgi:hypothetical protein